MFQSEEMSLIQLFLQYDTAYEVLASLGEHELVEFVDLHKYGAFHMRQFMTEFERCEEVLRRMDLMKAEVLKANFKLIDPDDDPAPPYSNEIYDNEVRKKYYDERSLCMFWKLEIELKYLNKNFNSTRRDLLKYIEYKHVMGSTTTVFEAMQKYTVSSTRLEEGIGSGSVGVIAGIVAKEKIKGFEQVIWRICQGNVFFSFSDIKEKIEDPDLGIEMYKCVFYIVYQSDKLESKITKVCEGYKANLYDCPADSVQRQKLFNEINSAVYDLEEIIYESTEQRMHILLQASFNILKWEIMVKKAKAIFFTMNKFQPDKLHKIFIAECWIPEVKIPELIKFLDANPLLQSEDLMRPVLVKIETELTPPTYHRLNKFTTVFQDLVNAYGINTYREHNPAPYYIITFPFLFSIMFGDSGHGAIMALAGILLIRQERVYTKKLPENEIIRIFYMGRYLILLMGLFSIHSGLIYNDCFAKPIHLFHSSWGLENEIHELNNIMENPTTILDPSIHWSREPYPFGIDPSWLLATNRIVIENSLKMKLSIIIGVCHMLFGIILNVNNILYLKSYSDIFTMFIPQLLFLTCLFFYLVILIFYKWIAYGPFKKAPLNEGCAEELYRYENIVELILLVIALVCIPWLFLAKPIYDILYEKYGFSDAVEARQRTAYFAHPYYDFCQQYGLPSTTQTSGRRSSVDKKQGFPTRRSSPHRQSIAASFQLYFTMQKEHETNFDQFVHQGIHSIEFFLGAVSNTASYLRLWALSLAHQQLSDVIWHQVFAIALHATNPYVQPVLIVVVFIFWAVLSVCILILMEGLSAFLHTLRLHWIEFQSKFYEGNGVGFAPFYFRNLLTN